MKNQKKSRRRGRSEGSEGGRALSSAGYIMGCTRGAQKSAIIFSVKTASIHGKLNTRLSRLGRCYLSSLSRLLLPVCQSYSWIWYVCAADHVECYVVVICPSIFLIWFSINLCFFSASTVFQLSPAQNATGNSYSDAGKPHIPETFSSFPFMTMIWL